MNRIINKILRDCCVMIGYRDMTVDLVLLDLQDFDVILGMDWLASYHASVDYFEKKVTFSIPSQPKFSFEGKHVDKPLRMISALRASSLLKKGCQGFLASVVSNESDLKLEDIPIVRCLSRGFAWLTTRERGGVHHRSGTRNRSYV